MKLRGLLTAVLLAVTLTACDSITSQKKSQESGSLSIKTQFSSTTPKVSSNESGVQSVPVDSGRLILSQGSQSHDFEVTIKSGSFSVDVNSVPVGDWYITLQFLNESNVITYQGTDNVSIKPAKTTEVKLKMIQMAGQLSLSDHLPILHIAQDHDARFINTLDGTLFAAGSNQRSALGLTANIQETAFWTETLDNVVYMDHNSNNDITFAVKGDGTLWAVGHNHKSVFGMGSDGQIYTEWTQVPGMSNVKTVDTSSYFAYALKKDGTLWSIGSNSEGNLGTGDKTSRSTWTHVLSNVKQVATGSWHAVALKFDGTVWVVGRDNEGQLGNGFDGASHEELNWVQVTTNATKVSAGSNLKNTYILKADKTVWGAGETYNGQLGLDTTVKQHSFVQIFSGADDIASAGYYITVLKDGDLWSTGLNVSGQLGDGTSGSGNKVTSFKKITLNHKVDRIFAGLSTSAIITTDGEVMAAGSNDHGELGNGTTSDYVPTFTPIYSGESQ